MEWRTERPLLDLRLLGGALFRQTNIATTCQTAAFLGGLIYITPIFLQRGGLNSPLMAGLVTAAVPVGVVTTAQTVGRRYSAIGPRRMVVAGEAALAAILAVLSFLGPAVPLWAIAALINRQLTTALSVSLATIVITALPAAGGLNFRVAYLVTASLAALAAFSGAFIDDQDDITIVLARIPADPGR